MTIHGLDDARRILGPAVLGPEEVTAMLGAGALGDLTATERSAVERIPFDRATLEAARSGDMLVLRLGRHGGQPLTMMALTTALGGGFDPRVHRGVGYSLRDEWTIDTQPFATQETCEAGWYLVRRTLLPATCNRLYRLQDDLLSALPDGQLRRPRRRSAIEIAYDTLLWHRARGERLLADAWDWSRTPSSDHGFVALGGFGDAGLGVIAYSRAVRFGSLGVCPQR